MVSVIIPIYNTEQYLDECIGSVTGQTYRDLEIILINDGSTDGSGELCRKWEKSDQRIRYIEKQNEGQGTARNLGIALATGEYILFVDSDDYLDRDLIHKAHDYISGQEADICVFAHYGVGDKTYISLLNFKLEQGKPVSRVQGMFGFMMPVLWDKMFSSNLIKETGLTMSNRICEDLVFNARLYVRAKKICMLDTPLYYYRYRREGNMATSYGRYLEVEESIDELNEIFQRDGLFEANWVGLYEISFIMFKDILFRIKKRTDLNLPTEARKQYPIFYQTYYDCLKKWFSPYLETGMQKKNYLLIGSYSLRAMIHALLLEEDFLREDYGASSVVSLMSESSEEFLPLDTWKFENNYRKRCVEQDITKKLCRKEELREIDYIVVDLLDEFLNLIKLRDKSYLTESEFLQEAGEESLKSYERIPFLSPERRDLFAAAIVRFSEKIKAWGIPVIVMKHFLCERHSAYYDTFSLYSDREHIKEQNQELEWCYEKLCARLPDALTIDDSGFEELRFTSDDFPFGCKPVYYNHVYYRRMAIRLGERIREKEHAGSYTA